MRVAVVLMELLSGFDFVDEISPFANGFVRRINLLSLIVVDRNEKLPAVGHVFLCRCSLPCQRADDEIKTVHFR